MRLWSIHPKYLDWKGLGAVWRESLLAQAVIDGKTKGWKNHPQLDRFKGHPKPERAIGYYLLEIFEESLRRGYNYNYSKINKSVKNVKSIPLTEGQLKYEYRLLMNRLRERTHEKYIKNKELGIVLPDSHPIFHIIPGPPGKWEVSYWRS